MRKTLIILLLTLLPSALAQSLWLELGLGYLEEEVTGYTAAPKLGLRATLPLGPTEDFSPELFAALALRSGLVVDAGLWLPFAPGPTDTFGLRSYAGAGLTLFRGEFGLAFTVAASYEISRGLDATFSYTHRPLLIPRLAQAFDVSLGVRFSFD